MQLEKSIVNKDKSMRSAIYEGKVWHKRFLPREHSFSYRVFMMYLDLSELDRVFSISPFYSAKHFSLAMFRRNDYFKLPGENQNTSLDQSIRTAVYSALELKLSGPIRLLTNLRYFGYLVNPISCYYCFDAKDEKLEAILIEVTNTPWEERTHYVLDCRGEAINEGVSFLKQMHVSPFMPLNMQYMWRGGVPDTGLKYTLTSVETNPDCGEVKNSEVSMQRHFVAGVNFVRKEINSNNLRNILVYYPLMTVKVVVAIYWQALRLFLKRMPFFPHPKKVEKMKFSERKL